MYEIKHITQSYPTDMKICLVLVSIFAIISIYIDNFEYTKPWFETANDILSIITLGITIFVPYWFSKKTIIQRKTGVFGSYWFSYWLLGVKINLLLYLFYSLWDIVFYIVRIISQGWESLIIYGYWTFVTPILGAFLMLFIGGISGIFAGVRHRVSKS
jgi:hypothetical protein